MKKIEFEPIEWVFIEAANQLGFDKKTFKERIGIGSDIFDEVKKYGVNRTFAKYNPDEPELFARAVIGMGDIVKGKPTAMTVGIDVASSGPQIFEVATRDSQGLEVVGAVDKIENNEAVVPDLYTSIYNRLKPYGIPNLSRKMVKEAVVPYAYGSSDSPKGTFGKWYKDFRKEYYNTIPAAETFKNLLIDAWRSDVVEYKWTLPDGFVATTVPTRNVSLKFQLLGSHSYTYVAEEPSALEKGELHTKALSANVIHSFDAFLLREMHRRCNYDLSVVLTAKKLLENRTRTKNRQAEHLESLFWKFNFFSMEIAEVIYESNGIGGISEEYISICLQYIDWLLTRKRFKLISIHDEFMTSPVNCNVLKDTYNMLLAELYRSDWMRVTVNHLRGDDAADRYIEDFDHAIYQKILFNTYAIS